MWRKRGLGFRLNFIIGILLITCCAAIISINIVLSSAALEEEIRATAMPAMTGEIAATINMRLGQTAKTLTHIGKSPELLNWIKTGASYEDLDSFLSTSRNFIYLHSVDGINLSIDESRGYYDITETGLIIRKIDPISDAWFFAFKSSNKPIEMKFGDPEHPEYGGKSYIDIRIVDEAGIFLGILSTSFVSDKLLEQITASKIGTKGVSFITHKGGEILLHPDKAKTYTQLAALPGFDKIAAQLLYAPDMPLETVNERGERILVSGRSLPDLEAIAFTVANTEELTGNSAKAFKYSALVGLAILLAGFLLSSRLVSAITRSFERVFIFAEHLASGKSVQPLNEVSSREMMSLSRSLNDMHSKLRKSTVSLETLHGVLNGIDALVLVSDPFEETILFMNDRLRNFLGLSEFPIGKKLRAVLPENMYGPCPLDPLKELENNGGVPCKWEGKNPATQRYYSVTESLINWAGHGKAHLQQSIDITDRANAENYVIRQRDQQAMLTDIAQSCLTSDDMDALIHDALRRIGEFGGADCLFLTIYDEAENEFSVEYLWSNPACEKCGRISPTVMGRLFSPFVGHSPSFAKQSGIRRIQNAPGAGAGEPVSFFGAPLIVGQRFWGGLALGTGHKDRAWTDNDSNLLRLTASILSGVISRHEAEKNLVLLSAIVESSPQLIAYLGENGEYLYVNPAAESITGYTKDELLSGNIRQLVSAADFDKFEQEMESILAKDSVSFFDLPITRKNGEQRVFSFCAFKTKFEELGIGFVGRDITENSILLDEIVKAKELAEKSSRAKSDFLSNMSHEIRTPLNAIVGMTKIGRSSEHAEKKEYCLEKVENASMHLLGVINDILDMSKIEADKFELAPTEFVFEKMLLRIINVVQFRIDEKQQKLSVNVDQNMPFSLIGDEQRLGQVIANLLSNAVKFTPDHGHIGLNVALLEEKEDAVLLEVRVSDTGIGIDEETQERLFKPFEQADGSTSRKFGGTGLGLAISHRIVELMGGRISIESTAGDGATFIFKIWAQRGNIDPRQLLGDDIRWEDIRLLVVDDAPDVREYFQGFAQSTGLTCDVAEDEKTALALIKLNGLGAYSAIFIDWQMPTTNGIELTRLITRQYGESPVIIMISGAEWRDIAEEALAAGVCKFLPKPLFSSQILDCITAGLARRLINANASQKREDTDNLFAGRRILLAEDIEINREIVTSLLENTGVKIDCAENGEEAWRLFKTNPGRYDLIFMDIHMPEVNGYEATRRIRALAAPQAAAVPIVAMTANAFREDIEQCLAAGMNAHLAKPIELGSVLEILRQYLLRPGAPA